MGVFQLMHPIFMLCVTHLDSICFPFAVGQQKNDSLPLFSGPFQWQRSWWRHWCQKEEKEAEKEEESWCHRSSPGPSCQGAQSMNYICLFFSFLFWNICWKVQCSPSFLLFQKKKKKAASPESSESHSIQWKPSVWQSLYSLLSHFQTGELAARW